MKRTILAIFMALALTIIPTGCEEYLVEKDETTDTLSVNELGIPSLSQELEIEDEDFTLICEYDTGNYPLENWKVTDSKAITMKVKTKGLPEGTEVYIDHVHADISLKSTSAQINGITQDTMDDTFHGVSQDGFFINDTSEYYNIFSIEGYTCQFYEMWGLCFGTYGTVSSSYERLTENNIIKVGTYAEKLSIVYDLSIKTPDSDKMYTKSVLSEVLIPLQKTE